MASTEHRVPAERVDRRRRTDRDGPAAARRPAIELRGLRRTFPTKGGEVTAVDGVDLTVHRGEVVALLGPNGAGKTTTLDMVLGLTAPSAGSVTVLGAGARAAVRAGRVSAVLQTGGLLGDLTVRETVRFIASTFTATGRATASVDEVLERAGVARLGRPAGGQVQRGRAAAAALRPGAAAGPRPARARRADGGDGRQRAAGVLGDDARRGGPRAHGRLRHPLPRGGRLLRPADRADGRRPGDRRRQRRGGPSAGHRAHRHLRPRRRGRSASGCGHTPRSSRSRSTATA